MEVLSPTAYVILGLIRKEPRSGYEIKAVVDTSTRFFWAASYGQIYPELKRLAEAGLVVGVDSPTGGRRRTVYAKVSRHELDGVLRLFDFPDANITSEKRTETTVPQQQLFVLNSPFMAERARGLAARLRAEAGDDDAADSTRHHRAQKPLGEEL